MRKVTVFGLNDTPVTTLGIGVFDGMHLGHQKIARQCEAILTFFPHPDMVLGKNRHIKALSTLKELRLFHRKVLVLRFTKEIARMNPLEFLNEVVLHQIRPQKIAVGYDFKFGHQKSGSIHVLKEWAAHHGIQVEEISPFLSEGSPVKSSSIRRYLEKGPFEKGIALLGHPYLIIGKVIKGHGKGKTIGFPTANLKVNASKLIPAPGVYKGKTEIRGILRSCFIYIGTKSTFGQHPLGIEVHIPQYDGNLYNRRLKIFLEAKLREDKQFSTPEALQDQIKKDLLK